MFRLLSILAVLAALAVPAAPASVASGKGSGGSGVGRVGGKMHYDDVSVGIITDKSLPKLLEAATKGAGR
jgi:hypothetical protein